MIDCSTRSDGTTRNLLYECDFNQDAVNDVICDGLLTLKAGGQESGIKSSLLLSKNKVYVTDVSSIGKFTLKLS